MGASGTERGSVTIWMLGLCVCVLFLGGLSVDLWRVFNERRHLGALADASAIVGAGALDETAWRRDRALRLEPSRAQATALAYLRPRVSAGTSVQVRAQPDRVQVRLGRTVRLSLLGLLAPQREVPVSAEAVVRPARSP